jgi:hypothetical protein
MSAGLATIEPRHNFESMSQIAEVVSKSGLFGRMTETQVLTLMMLCESEGIHPIKALQLYDIIEGKPSLKAVALLARFLESGGQVEWHEQSNTAAEATFMHPKTCPKGVTVRYTIEDAKLAALANKDNWKKNPADMLVARVCSRGAKRANPACILGMDLPEADEPPPVIETTARASLVEHLAGRRESPKESHPPVAETAAALKDAPKPEPPREPESEWGKMIAGAVLEFNRALGELAEAYPCNLALRKAMTTQQAVNGVVKALVAEGLSEDALKTDGKRDAAKVRRALDDIWANDSEHLEGVAAKYLGAKMTELMGPAVAPAQAELAMA